MTDFTIQKLCTIHNLRMKEGQWLIDVTYYSSNKKTNTKTITIGKRLAWQKLSEKIPEVVLNKRIKNSLTKDLKGVTFAKFTVEKVDDGGYLIPLDDEEGNMFINTETGKDIHSDLSEEIRRRRNNL
ncbi:MAG: hypothetical protein D4S01_08650 [Dehalococcoidia bacterium]|nr:MAG: hypothetical protein D4S01_08650 [Dehalococcoidia bacterium]